MLETREGGCHCGRVRFRARVDQMIAPLTSVLNWAAKRDWCKRPAFDRPKFNDRRKRWADYDESARLVAAASPHLRPILLFLMLTGCRISEGLSLDWEDVDLGARWLVFRNTKRNKGGPDMAGEDRGVSIHPQLILALANLPMGINGRQGRVFRTPARAGPQAPPFRPSAKFSMPV